MITFVRFLYNHRLFTTINMLGFAMSIGYLLLLGDLVYRQTSVESFQTRGERTYVVGNEEFMMSNFREGEHLAAKFPEIEDWCAIGGYELTAKKDGMEIKAPTLVARDNFFSFFDYGLEVGDRERVLSDVNNIVVSRSFAEKYFGDKDPIGKELELMVSSENNIFTISGIMEDIDRATIPSAYECVIPLENLKQIHYSAYREDMSNAGAMITYVMAREGCDLLSRRTDMADYFRTFFWLYQNGVEKEVTLTPLSTLYYDGHGASLSGRALEHGNRAITGLYIVIGILVLIFAIFNYVNLSVTLTSERSKEMATRRLLGSQSTDIFVRLMMESIVFTAISFVMGVMVAVVAQDKASLLVNCHIDLMKDFTWWHIVAVAVAIGLVGMLAGMVPSSILSNYKPIDIVRGTFRRTVRQKWSHVLMVMQTTFTLVMLTTVLVLSSNMEEKMSTPLGYEYENIVEVMGQFESLSQMKTAREKIASLPEVESVGLSYSTPMSWLENNTTNAADGTVVPLRIMMGDTAAFNILGLHPEMEYEREDHEHRMVGVNKYLLKLLSLPEDAREFAFKNGEETWHVAKLYPDIIYQSVISDAAESPFIYMCDDEYEEGNPIFKTYGKPRNLLVKYNPRATTLAEIDAKMSNIVCETTGHDYYYTDPLSKQHKEWYREYEQFLEVLKVFTLLSFIISILGLLAMNSYFINNRKREIAVRKVLGSTTAEVVGQLMRQIMIQFAVSVVLSIPLSMWLSPMVASMSGLEVGMEWMPFVWAALSIAAVITVTVMVQSIRAANENPVVNIKTE